MTESLRGFTSSCFAAKENCSLNSLSFTSAEALSQAIGNTVDTLYASPVAIEDLAFPTIVTASDLRFILGWAMYSVTRWPLLSDLLVSVISGDLTLLATLTKPWVDATYAGLPDTGTFAQQIIFVSDPSCSLTVTKSLNCLYACFSATIPNHMMIADLLQQRQK